MHKHEYLPSYYAVFNYILSWLSKWQLEFLLTVTYKGVLALYRRHKAKKDNKVVFCYSKLETGVLDMAKNSI